MSGLSIAKNAAYNIIAFVVTLVVTFLLVPVMLVHLGEVGFGVWAIARVFVSYASLSDFGLSSTVTKFVAEIQPQQDWKRMSKVLQSAFILYSVIALVVLLLVWMFSEFLVTTFFSQSGQFSGDVRFVLIGSLSIFAVNLIGTVFSSAMSGLQRMDITNLLTAGYWLINGVAMYVALVLGYGLRGIIYANAFATAIFFLMNAFFFFRLFSHIPLFAIHFRFQDLRESLRYSKDIFVIAIANSIHLHYDKLLLSSFVSVGAVSNYEVASRVVQVMRQIVVLLLNPILPVASELQAQQRSESILRLYYRSLKFLIFFCVPFFACVGVYASQLITLWIGGNNVLIIATLQALLFSNFVNLMTGPAYFIALGVGKARVGMYSSMIGLAINVILSLIFLKSFGYGGLLVGTSLALGCEAVLFLTLFHRVIGARWGNIAGFFVQPLGVVIIAMAAGIGIGILVSGLLLKTVIMLSVSIAVYFLFMMKPHYFDEDDRTFLKELKGKIVGKFMGVPQSQQSSSVG